MALKFYYLVVPVITQSHSDNHHQSSGSRETEGSEEGGMFLMSQYCQKPDHWVTLISHSQNLLFINKMHNNLETNQCSYSWTGLSLGSSVLMMIFMSVLESQPSLSTLDVFPVFNFYCQYILG